MTNLIEDLRKASVEALFDTSFGETWNNNWKNELRTLLKGRVDGNSIFNVGDILSELFQSTSSGRTQSSVSGGGYKWECLVCWYLNLCLIGTHTVVIKQNKSLVPEPIRDSTAVYYGTFRSDTEADLIAISFPDRNEYTANLATLKIRDSSGTLIDTYKKSGDTNRLELLNVLSERDFDQYKVNIIQCKTNWNDNAQIPMLWDMIYSADTFKSRSRISIGSNGFSINNLQEFKYSFITVPTNNTPYYSTSTSVQRVTNLSGGNFWGKPSDSGVASSLKEIFDRNFSGSYSGRLTTHLDSELKDISTKYSYFKLI